MGFYGYDRRRRRDNVVNWSKVSQDIGNTIVQGAKDREAKRQELDENSRVAEKFVKDVPQGQNETLNTAMIDLSGQMANRLLENKKLLKSGKISPTEYNKNIQTVRDEIELLYKGVNGWNETYAQSADRLQKGVSAGTERFIMSEAEGYADFSNTKMILGPDNKIVAVKVDDEGKPIEGSSIPVQTLFGRVAQKVDKIDVDGELDAASKSLGSDIRGFANDERYGTISDIMNTKRYKEAEDTYIESLLTSPLQAGNILHDWVGTTKDGRDYEFTTNEDEAKEDDSKILLVRDRSGNLVPELSTEQEEWMRDQIRKGLRSRLDYESDVKLNQRSGSTKITAAERKNMSRAESLYTLYSGDPNKIQEGFSLLRGQKDKNGYEVTDIKRSSNSLILTVEDSKGNSSVENISIGNDPQSFVTGLMNRFFGDASGVQYLDFGGAAPGTGVSEMDITKIASEKQDDSRFSTSSGVSIIARGILMKDGEHIIGRITEDSDVRNIKNRIEKAIVEYAPQEMAENMSINVDPSNDDGLIIAYGNSSWSIDLDNNAETVDKLDAILQDIRNMHYGSLGSGSENVQSKTNAPRASENGGSSR
jgi:hypothetical protein